MTRHIVSIIFSLFVTLAQLSAQEYSYKQYTVDDGLPSNYVYGAVEVNDGFIWIYTENGISKFDGYKFKNYTVENGLISNDIIRIVKDSSGMLWLNDTDCTISFIRNDSIINMYEAGPEENILSCGLGNSKDHVVYFRTKQLGNNTDFDIGYFLYNNGEQIKSINATEILKKINDLDKEASKGINGFHIASDSSFLTTDTDLNRLYQIRGEDYSIRTFDLKCTRSPSLILSSWIVQYEKTYLAIVYEFDFHIIDVQSKTCTKYNWADYFKDARSLGAIDFLDSSFIISSDKGYLEFGDKLNIVDQRDLSQLSSNYLIRRSYVDKKNNLWIGTKEGGLFFLNKSKQTTELLMEELEGPFFCEFLTTTKEGELLAISNYGDVHLVSIDGKLKKIRSGTNATDVRSICSGKDSSIFISTSTGAFQYRNQTFIDFSRNYESNNAPPWNYTNIVYSPKNNQYYLTQYKSTFISNDLLDFESEVISTGDRRLFYDSLNDELYSAKKDGLYKISDDNIYDKLIDLKLISSFYSLSKDVIWLGTESSGVYSFNLSTKELIKIADYSFVRKIIMHQDQFFFATNNGVYQSKIEDGQLVNVYNYNIKDGLPALEIRDIIIHGDYLYIGTHQGLVKTKIRKNEVNEDGNLGEVNPLQLTHVANMDSELAVENNSSFQHDQNDMSFSYRLLNYESEGDVEYLYKLDPIHSDWHSTKELTLSFSNLQPGDYSFNLKANDAFLNSYSVSSPYDFEIKKPFYKTIPFYISSIVFIGACIYLYEKRRVRLQREELDKKNELNKRMANIKLEALQSQMNPHFIFNSLGAIQYHIQTHRVDEADNYLTLFAQLMRKYLNSASQNTINLKEEVSLLEDYVSLEKMRFEKMFTTEIIVDPSIDMGNRDIPPMMIQPFVENAINHGLPGRKDEKGILEIEFLNAKNDNLIVEIRDNGIGIKQAKQSKHTSHVSKGMQNIENRISFLKTIGIVDVKINVLENSNDSRFPGTTIRLHLNFINDEV